MMYRRLLLILLIVCNSLRLAASAPIIDNYKATHYNLNNGLPHNFVDDIYLDSSGFAWISLGGGGLVRFDGFDYLRYNPSSTLRPISGDFVKKVVEDKFSRLWVATDNGLSLIDLLTLSPIDIAEIDDALKSYRNQIIDMVALDGKDRLWLRHNAGFDCIEFDEEGQVQKIHKYAFNILSQYNSLFMKDVLGDGTVWTAFRGILHKLTPQSKGDIKAEPLDAPLLPDAVVNDMMLMDDVVWIATDKGLVKHTLNGKGQKTYLHAPADPHSITQDLITALAISPEGYLIAATLNGINFYDPAIDGFIHETVQSSSGRLSANFVNCLLVSGGNIWIGTETGGMNVYSEKNISTLFEGYQPHNPNSLPNNPVNAIFEDAEGTLWIGVVEGGLSRRRINEKSFQRFTTANSGLRHNSVSTIASDSKGRLWIGTWGGGVDVLDVENPQINYMHMLQFGAFGSKPYIGVIAYDDINKGMWIGTSNGVYFYDLVEEKIIEPVAPIENTLRGCIGAAIDHDNHLWMGTMHGVVDIDLTSRNAADKWAMRTISHKLDAEDSKMREKTSYAYVDTRGTLWIASDIHGLYKREVVDGVETFENITIDDGLVQNAVLGIAEDNKGRLWLSTNQGLSCYFPDEKRFVNYTRADGLETDMFYWNAAAKSHSGNVYFGAIDGLLSINSAMTQKEALPHKVAFTRIIIDNQPIIASRQAATTDISKVTQIHLHERNKTFSIEFSALDYVHNPAYNYWYKFEGFDKEWVRLPHGRHFVTYTNIHPGTYHLLVSYQPGAEPPTTDYTSLEVIVERYFYHTAWFAIFMATLLALAIWAIARWRMRGIEEKKKELELAVEQRTAEISRQKQMLEERTMRIQELTVERLSFFTNLTHEFRTPITLIMGPVHRALRLCKDANVRDQLKYVERNATYLLNLVNELMDFRKIESGKMEIIRKRSNFSEFLNEVVDSFRMGAEERNIQFVTLTHLPKAVICYDKEAVRKLLTNILGNAVKYTPDGGLITIYAALLPSACTPDGTEHLYICVSDTGDGINPDDIDKVFNRFYQGKSFMKYPTMQASSGIGLHLCKCIVEAYGGHISVRNNAGCGCRFRIVIPVPDYDDEAATIVIDEKSHAMLPADDSQRRLNIMVIEDNEDMRGYIKSILASKYNITEACNGEEALKLLADNDIDFIISDQMMPVMDGIEFARRAKENFATSHIPILMLTARTSDESKIESYRSGVDDYICKPFNEDLLLTRIENIMANKQRHQRQFAVDYDTADLQLEESHDKKFLDQVMTVLKENYQNSYFDMGDFAEALGVSRSVLNKKLQSLVGQSSNEFVRNYRLKLAHQIIVNNKDSLSLNISEIAYDVGFNDAKYFSRCFTKQYGIPPSKLMTSKE